MPRKGSKSSQSVPRKKLGVENLIYPAVLILVVLFTIGGVVLMMTQTY
jgi:hypothetical protein